MCTNNNNTSDLYEWCALIQLMSTKQENKYMHVIDCP